MAILLFLEIVYIMPNHYNLDGARKVTELAGALVRGLEEMGAEEETLFRVIQNQDHLKALLVTITDSDYFFDDELVVSEGRVWLEKIPDHFSTLMVRM
ncbi:MAG: hypothetical protein FJY91_02110 [Candidatus Harrisonbacteria bacterium]|nr:hypothetical protein [Candidatus Harrisonbacteria bacterium]